MKPATRLTGVVACAAVTALISAGCGSDDTESAAEEKPITVGTGNYPPDQFLDEDGRTVRGWSVDILNAVGEQLGREIEITSTAFPGILPAVQSHRFEIGSSSYAVTDERLAAVDFVTYYEGGQLLAVKAGNPEQVDPDEVCGIRMGAVQGALSEITAKQLSADCEAASKAPVEIAEFPAFDNVYLAIGNGRVDAAAINATTVDILPEEVEALGDRFMPQQVGFIFAKDRTDLRDEIAAALQEIMDNGTYLEILEEWGIEDGAVEQAETLSQKAD